MVKPITPKEAASRKIEVLPDEVIDVFNTMILENLKNGSSVVMQDEVARRIAKRMNVVLGYIYEKGLLDVEEIYRKAGWDVEYDKPGYNEDYKARFVFSKKAK